MEGIIINYRGSHHTQKNRQMILVVKGIASKKAAEKLLAEKRHDAEGFAEATAVLEKELARLRVTRRHRARKGSPPVSSE